jgi:hypothetical protein
MLVVSRDRGLHETGERSSLYYRQTDDIKTVNTSLKISSLENQRTEVEMTETGVVGKTIGEVTTRKRKL